MRSRSLFHITVTEIADKLGISRPTALKYLKTGKIRGRMKRFGYWRVERAEFEAWLSEQHQPSPVPKQKVVELIYFVEVQNESKPIKIGHSTNRSLAQRLSSLRVSSAYPLKLLCTMPGGQVEEAALHRKFKAERLSGEWFRPSPKLRKYLETLPESKDRVKVGNLT